ncbi:hypothetical protein M885DRAFT_560411 [Pelagophyceae sp. CCMP2097]|nr:hypothetical protein M885DRAFT_560411 [Pelagophyceae sp. CCMP2097]|mmetsp:Transcript_21966/g.76068  ORF Transcript_21966/g.76068 Transcript_21966/m.76068 type:complete len:237 (+) Transcript_21966:177-887(+)
MASQCRPVDVQLGGVTIRLFEVPDLAETQWGGNDDPTGRVVWPSGFAAAAELESLSARRKGGLVGLRVLELGCGNGLASLAALRFGADVLATDCAPSALALVKRAANEADAGAGSLKVAQLDVASAEGAAAFDAFRPHVVVAADLLYSAEVATALGNLLRGRCPPAALIVVDPGRAGRGRFLQAYAGGDADAFFDLVFEKVPEDRQPKTFRGEAAPPSDRLGRLAVGLDALIDTMS